VIELPVHQRTSQKRGYIFCTSHVMKNGSVIGGGIKGNQSMEGRSMTSRIFSDAA